MHLVHVLCSEHGDIEVTTADVVAMRIHYEGNNESYQYRFRCTLGREVVVKKCEPGIYDLLCSSEVSTETINMPLRNQPQFDQPLVELVEDLLIDIHTATDEQLATELNHP